MTQGRVKDRYRGIDCTMTGYSGNEISEISILHGVFMEIAEIGVLLVGQSGLGKSELALDLISRGHRLIADDAPEFTRIAADTICGTCPVALQDFLEVRGLGVLNVREMYGEKAVKSNQHLELIVKLVPAEQTPLQSADRIRIPESKIGVLGVDIPMSVLPATPNRNLAVLVEAAARSQSLSKRGYVASQDFSDRQKKLMQ